jgi:hypothetical protein
VSARAPLPCTRLTLSAAVTVRVAQHFVAFLNATCYGKSTACSGYLLGEYVVRSIIMLATIVALNFNVAVRLCEPTTTPRCSPMA